MKKRNIEIDIWDLVVFANQLREQMKQMVQDSDRFNRYFGGKDLAGTLLDTVERAHRILIWGYEYLGGNYHVRESKVYDKETGIIMKRLLLRLEYLLCKIKAFDEEEGPKSKLIETCVIKGTTWEADLLKSGLIWNGDYTFRYAVKERVVVGRQYEKVTIELVELLFDSQSKQVVPILGKPGMGKSALARLFFNSEEVQKYFHSCFWLFVTDARTPEDLMRAVSESSILRESGSNDRMLVVLDGLSEMNIFNSLCSEDKADPTFCNFVKGMPQGTKILVTSRLEPPRRGELTVSVPSLHKDESWDLFKDIALPNSERLPVLSSVGLEICQKCENIPGIIKIIASIMSSKTTPGEWEHFRDVVLTSVPYPITTLSSAFMLITDQNQKERRECFSWCSLLPIDYEFRRDHLLHLLTKQPVIRSSRVTEKGLDRFFKEFIKDGFFVKCDSVDSIARYKVSYLGHELMKHLAGEEFCLVETPTFEPDYRIVRHASFIVDSSWGPPSWLSKAKLLKTLLFWPRISGEFISLPKMYLFNLRELHTVYCGVPLHFESLPMFTVKSRKMRYLKLWGVSTISLPEDISTLGVLLHSNNPLFDGELKSLNPSQNIESLKVDCRKKETWQWAFDEFSTFLRDLVSIRIANCSGCHYLPAFSSLPHLSSLKLFSLRSLVNIVISDKKSEASSTRMFYPSLKVMVLCDLPELKGWSKEEGDNQQYCFPVLTQVKLQGCPKLTSMPPVPTLVSLEAINSNAKLVKELICPQDLSVVSSSSIYINSSVSCSDWLVEELEIDGCEDIFLGGNPNDVEKGVRRDLRYLRSLKLKNYEHRVSLPVDPEFIGALEQLSLNWLTNLQVLPEWIGQFTQLRQLSIHYCINLISLPTSHDSFSTLQQLDIRYCPRLSQFPESLPSLKKLRVQENCRFEDLLRASHNLEELEIDDCDEGDSSTGIWGGLERLHTLKFIKMESLPNSPDFGKLSKLRQLFIQHCPHLTTLPDSLCSLPAIEHLHIKSCPRLTHLPQEFPNLKSLTHLEIKASSQLEKICRKSSGEEWRLIQQIPNIKCDKWSHSENSSPVSSPESKTNVANDNLQPVRPKLWVAARKTLAKAMHLC